MADKLHVSTEWLDRCAREIAGVSEAIADAQRTLSGIHLSHAEGADLRLQLSCALRLPGRSYTGATTQEDIRQLAGAARDLSGRVRQLSQAATRAARAFEAAENEAARMSGAQKKGGNSEVYKGVAGVAGGAVADTVLWYRQIMNWLMELWNRISHYTSSVNGSQPGIFDESQNEAGMYGGNQGAPVNDAENYAAYREIIRNNTGVDLSDESPDGFSNSPLQNYLSGLNNEGCGYVAMANAIFLQYQGRPGDFERDFGFPMYRNGNLNYNELVVDIYSMTDNYNRDSNGNYTFNEHEDYNSRTDGPLSDYDYYEDTSRRGVNQTSWEDRMERYLSERHVDGHVVSFQASAVTPENCQSYINEYGNLRISVSQFTLHSAADGSDAGSYYNGGHAMTVVGMENGMYVVSSWGKKYYLNPSECNIRYFQSVDFNS